MKKSAKARQMQFRVVKGTTTTFETGPGTGVSEVGPDRLQIFFLGKWQDLPVYDEDKKEYIDDN